MNAKELFNRYRQYRKDKLANEKKPETFTEIIWSWIKTLAGAIVFVMIINGILVASFVVPTGSMEKTVMTGDFLFVNKFIFGPSSPQIVPFINVPLPYYKLPGLRDPRKGDVIVFVFPGVRDEAVASEFQYYLKRCVATAGDTVYIQNNVLFVNSVKQTLAPHAVFCPDAPRNPMETLLTFPRGRNYTHDNFGPLRVPKKGDLVQLTAANFQEWETFIQREGHKVTMVGDTINIDGANVNSYKVERDYCFGMGDNRDQSLDSRFWGFIPYKNVIGKPIVVYWSWPMINEFELPLTIGEKLKNIRWSRIGNFID